MDQPKSRKLLGATASAGPHLLRVLLPGTPSVKSLSRSPCGSGKKERKSSHCEITTNANKDQEKDFTRS